MIGFLGSDVGPGAMSDATKDCPKHTPADNTRKPASDLEIMTSPQCLTVERLQITEVVDTPT
jgi:hypothetical protein